MAENLKADDLAVLQEKVLGNPGDMDAMREMLNFLTGTQYEDYKNTALAGRVAAVYGIAKMSSVAENPSHSMSKHACKDLLRPIPWLWLFKNISCEMIALDYRQARLVWLLNIYHLEMLKRSCKWHEFLAAGEAGKCLWDKLYERACVHHEKHQSKRMVHNLDEQGRLRLRIWQATCCCVCFAPKEDLLTLISSIFDMLQVMTPRSSPLCTQIINLLFGN